MAYRKDKILVGAADLYLGATDAVDETLTPDTTARIAYEASATWRALGLTMGGVEVTYAPDFGEVEVDQLLDTPRMYKQRQSMSVTTSLAEITLDNMVFAWGLPADALTGDEETSDATLTFSGGQLAEEPEERSLTMIGLGPTVGTRRKERVYRLARVLNVESASLSLSRNEATGIPVSMRCLPDASDALNVNYGSVTDRFITAA